MTEQQPEMQSLVQRLEKLEGQNRRMKQIGALVLVVAASLFLMGQTPANRTVEASKFILYDSSGKQRAVLATAADGQGSPALMFTDADGWIRLQLAVNKSGSPQLSMFNGQESIHLSIPSQVASERTLDGPTAQLEFKHADHPQITLESERFGGVGLEMNGKVPYISMIGDTPSIWMLDTAGFQASIGSTDLKTSDTGETHRTSAASVILFGKDKKVLWRAPGK